MMPTRHGSLRLFRLFGIEVFLHWSWFLVALYEVTQRGSEYDSLIWNLIEYVALFGIVTMHEFGHALACRQTGGRADQIILWPLGGVAYVAPPQRAGAMLWSIVAGPLVNLILLPFLFAALWVAVLLGWESSVPNLYLFVRSICWINTGLLIFNLLPVYPLDGGQILRSLLWFPLGRGRSLLVASLIGLPFVAGLLVFLVWKTSDPIAWLMCLFILANCWRGFREARILQVLERIPRRHGYQCPACGQAPILGPAWQCSRCGERFDLFAREGACPACGSVYPVGQCLDCGCVKPFAAWDTPAKPPPILPRTEP